MLQKAFPKATDVNSLSCFSNRESHKYGGLSPSCGVMWVLQLVLYYLKKKSHAEQT